jgi:hypothetical protein
MKVCPGSADAESVTLVFAGTDALQTPDAAPEMIVQLMPSAGLVTLPIPVPAPPTPRVNLGPMNVARAVLGADITSWHVVEVPLQFVSQLEKV